MTIRDSIRYRDRRDICNIALFQAQHGRAPYLREMIPFLGVPDVKTAGKRVDRIKRLYRVRRDGRLFVIPGMFTPRKASA